MSYFVLPFEGGNILLSFPETLFTQQYLTGKASQAVSTLALALSAQSLSKAYQHRSSGQLDTGPSLRHFYQSPVDLLPLLASRILALVLRSPHIADHRRSACY